MLSTPFLQQGFFYEAWHGGNWARFEVPSRDCPRISAAWLEERRREDPLKFAREYECKWSAAFGAPRDRAVFAPDPRLCTAPRWPRAAAELAVV